MPADKHPDVSCNNSPALTHCPVSDGLGLSQTGATRGPAPGVSAPGSSDHSPSKTNSFQATVRRRPEITAPPFPSLSTSDWLPVHTLTFTQHSEFIGRFGMLSFTRKTHRGESVVTLRANAKEFPEEMCLWICLEDDPLLVCDL